MDGFALEEWLDELRWVTILWEMRSNWEELSNLDRVLIVLIIVEPSIALCNSVIEKRERLGSSVSYLTLPLP